MPEPIFYDGLGAGRRIEASVQLEHVLVGENAVLLREIDVGRFGAGQARLVVRSLDEKLKLGFKTAQGALESGLIVHSGMIVSLAAAKDDLLRRFEGTVGDVDIDVEFTRYTSDDVPPRLVKIRVRMASGLPPDILIEDVEHIVLEAERVDEIDEPVLFARFRVRNSRRAAPYSGPPASLLVRAVDDGVARDAAPLVTELLSRRASDGKTRGAGSWPRGELPPLSLPLDDKEPLVLEFGLPATIIQTWLRSRGTNAANPAINLRLIIVSAADGSELAERRVSLELRLLGSPGDILLLRTGNESVRFVLRSGEVPVQPLRHLRTALRTPASGTELGLEALVFDATVISNESGWILEPEATLTDHDSGEHDVEILDDQMLLVNVGRPVYVPLPEMAARLSSRNNRLENTTLEVRFRLRLPSAPGLSAQNTAGPDSEVREAVVKLNVAVDRWLPSWMACVDFGASAIAVGLAPGRVDGSGRGRMGALTVLPLGDWFGIIDKLHPEIANAPTKPGPPRRSRQAATGASVLLPSYIGLSSARNLRTHSDPLSLGDLEAALDGSVLQRLTLLKREYDLSIPYPSNERLPDEFGKIIFALKRELAKDEAVVRTKAKVATLRSGVLESTNEISVARLFAECFHELGGFLLPRVLHHATKPGMRDRSSALSDFSLALETGATDCVGVVVTHPFGLDVRQLAVYREAGRAFLSGLMGCSPDDPGLGKIVPVPEALAAARYGLVRLLEQPVQPDGWLRIICLDIGASTYDVTVIDAEVQRHNRGQPLRNWKVQEHFGLLVGGADLDAAIARRVIAIVEAAADVPEIDAVFAVETNLKAVASQIDAVDNPVLRRKQRNFLEALQRAKKDLAARLLDTRNDYQWRDQRLSIEIGTNSLPEGNGDDKPLACLLPQRFPQQGEEAITIPIPDMEVDLQYGRDANGNAFVNLLITPNAFDARPNQTWFGAQRVEDTDVGWLTEVLARRIPELAAAGASGMASEPPNIPTWWIVTGRAALWPPIYGGITKVAQSYNGMILGEPFRPEEMKRAVLEGALRLAVETYLPLTTVTPPTIGILIREGGKSIFEPLSIQQPARLGGRVPVALVRMLPGLARVHDRDRLQEAFEAAGLQPWSILESDIRLPMRDRIEITCTRTEQGIEVTVSPEGAKEPKRKYGPYREDRIYGTDF